MMVHRPSIVKTAQHEITVREKLRLGREVMKMATVVPDLLLLPVILLNRLYLIFILPSVCQMSHRNICVVSKKSLKKFEAQ